MSYIKLGGIVALAALVLLAIFLVASAFDERDKLRLEVAALNTSLQTCRDNSSLLENSIKDQNKAVADLEAAAVARENAATEALLRAEKQGATLQARINTLLIKQRPAGDSACTNAKRLIDEELSRGSLRAAPAGVR